MQRWITGHHHSAKRPISAFRHQFCPARICQHIETNSRKCAAFTLILTQDVVVGLVLELVRLEQGRQLSAKKPHCVELVTFTSHSHPDEVQVVGHQTISWTPYFFANSRVQQEFSKMRMKRFVQPAGSAKLHSQRPHDNRITLVTMAKQPWQIVLLLDKPVHFHRSRVCETRHFSPVYSTRAFTSAATSVRSVVTPASSSSHPRPVS